MNSENVVEQIDSNDNKSINIPESVLYTNVQVVFTEILIILNKNINALSCKVIIKYA